jgi:regulator of protease activity HflC (stomatin/prohibitin superfamily)
VRAELDQSLGKQGIIIESVMLKDLELPESYLKPSKRKLKLNRKTHAWSLS